MTPNMLYHFRLPIKRLSTINPFAIHDSISSIFALHLHFKLAVSLHVIVIVLYAAKTKLTAFPHAQIIGLDVSNDIPSSGIVDASRQWILAEQHLFTHSFDTSVVGVIEAMAAE